jgi:chemotaxis protein MotA
MGSSGFAYGFAVVFLIVAAIWTSPEHPLRFLDPHGLYMVAIGTAIIALIAVPWESLKRFFPMIRVVSRRLHDDSVEVVQQLVEMAEKAKIEVRAVADVLPRVKDPFLRDSIEILVEGFDAAEIETILRRRVEVQKERENADAKIFRSLGKYPPATGLIGTVMGMIALLATLGQEGAESRIGPAMSVAMSATLYGVIIANLIILPVADHLLFRTQRMVAKRELIIEGVLLVKQQIAPVMVKEILVSHLAPHQRAAFKAQPAGASRQAA